MFEFDVGWKKIFSADTNWGVVVRVKRIYCTWWSFSQGIWLRPRSQCRYETSNRKSGQIEWDVPSSRRKASLDARVWNTQTHGLVHFLAKSRRTYVDEIYSTRAQLGSLRTSFFGAPFPRVGYLLSLCYYQVFWDRYYREPLGLFRY